jgi:hypothetical protein
MKTLIFVSICLLFQKETSGQNVFLSNQIGQNAIIGIGNILEFTGIEKKEMNFVVYTNNGEIRSYPTEKSKEYLWFPENEGKGIITIYKKNKKDSIILLERVFNVTILPLSVFHIEKSSYGYITLDSLLTIEKPIVNNSFSGCIQGYNLRTVRKYSIMAIRNKTVLFDIENNGMVFSSNTIKSFMTLEPKDIVFFYNIFDANMRKLNPTQIIIY